MTQPGVRDVLRVRSSTRAGREDTILTRSRWEVASSSGCGIRWCCAFTAHDLQQRLSIVLGMLICCAMYGGVEHVP